MCRKPALISPLLRGAAQLVLSMSLYYQGDNPQAAEDQGPRWHASRIVLHVHVSHVHRLDGLLFGAQLCHHLEMELSLWMKNNVRSLSHLKSFSG